MNGVDGCGITGDTGIPGCGTIGTGAGWFPGTDNVSDGTRPGVPIGVG